MRVCIDLIGHFDLAHSFYALFHKRLGHDVRFCFGEGWEKTGLTCYPVESTEIPKTCMIGFEEWADTEWDLSISTCDINEIVFHDLCKEHGKAGVFIRQIANLLEQPKAAKNVMMAILHTDDLPAGTNWITYIPEHPHYFKPVWDRSELNQVVAIENYLHQGTIGPEIFEKMKALMTEIKFDCLPSTPHPVFCKHLQNSLAYVHIKKAGSCGFTLREAMFCGLPVIVNKAWSVAYKTLSHTFLVDGINCIDIDEEKRPIDTSLDMMKEWLMGDQYLQRCIEAYRKTLSLIDFRQESQKVSEWINKL